MLPSRGFALLTVFFRGSGSVASRARSRRGHAQIYLAECFVILYKVQAHRTKTMTDFQLNDQPAEPHSALSDASRLSKAWSKSIHDHGPLSALEFASGEEFSMAMELIFSHSEFQRVPFRYGGLHTIVLPDIAAVPIKEFLEHLEHLEYEGIRCSKKMVYEAGYLPSPDSTDPNRRARLNLF